MDPNIQEAERKKDQAEQIESTAAQIRGAGNPDTALNLEAEAANLRQQAEQERTEAETQAQQEKDEIDRKYGTG